MPVQWMVMSKLLALLAVVQSAECLRLARAIPSIWRWEDLQDDYSQAWLRRVLGLCLQPFRALNALRILTATWFFLSPHWTAALILLLVHLLTLLRFRGTFNGGSDSMNLMLLICVSIAWGAADHPQLQTGALWYVALQLCLSYWRAGVAKLRNEEWRTGTALQHFITSPLYRSPSWLLTSARTAPVTLALSWLIILFELTFPLSLLDSRLALGYMAAGLIFHSINTYLFGLNRFLFAWLAAYPALW